MARTPLSTIAQFAPCTIFIRGKVMFSRLSSRIEGAELDTQNQVAKAKGRPVHQKPYITITIKDPVIVNTNLPQQVASVISERFFTRTDGTVTYTQESKSPFWPQYLYSAEVDELKNTPVVPNGTTIPNELAVGMDVTIGADLFVMKGSYGNAGLGIKYIILNEPVKYFSRGNSTADLEALGMSYTPNTAQQTQVVKEAQTASTVQNVAPPQQMAQPYTQPQQYSAPQQYTQPTAYSAPQQMAQPQYAKPTVDADIPFSQAPISNTYGVEQQIQRPVRNN